MDFSLNNIGWSNLFENGYNFISFSIMGMLIVFCGLSIISIYIMLLPKILEFPKRFISQKTTKKQKGGYPEEPLPGQDPELLLAIAVALHLEQTNTGSFEKITWKRSGEPDSAWLTAGRMRGLAVRSHLPDHRS
ncbi:MAG: OadG family protein [Deltaproteobacteria bacterium]|jgi:Na+-transporting methylmalonyl-CoA/oxaloacetate decarboxylase gamma subunit|nr:OadG family protein [Deltaproteobacteria bacterium]